MSLIYFITHPEVTIDPAVKIPDWNLSEVGILRAQHMLNQPWISTIQTIFSSEERKAHQTAEIIAQHLQQQVFTDSQLGEIDRSASGFIPEPEFNMVVSQFFARPQQNIRGWEKATHAQERISRTFQTIIDTHPNQNIAIVSHGGVGGLLVCHLKKVPIHQRYTSPRLGSYFVYDSDEKVMAQEWRSIDE
jgi:broad specificity phosphatase PhoE